MARLRHAADVVRIAKAANLERGGNKLGALNAISKANFRTRFGQVWGDLYRAKLIIRANQPGWRVSVEHIAKSVGQPQDVRYAQYFGWYAQYMLALSTDDEALEVEAVKQLDRQEVIKFLRRTLPYFPAPLVKR
jgi:hypothetical protein